jgi:outer membrane biosynthesis protein TonB
VVEEIETVELEIEIQQPVEPETAQEEMEVTAEVEEEIQEAEVAEQDVAEQETPTETASTDEPEEQQEEQAEPAQKKTVAQKVKEKVAKKIMSKMNDKSKYDSTNQVRTLAVMGVLGNSRSFFGTQATLQDTPGFFSGATIPDSTLPTNNIAQYLMFGGSSQAHSEIVNSQWR